VIDGNLLLNSLDTSAFLDSEKEDHEVVLGGVVGVIHNALVIALSCLNISSVSAVFAAVIHVSKVLLSAVAPIHLHPILIRGILPSAWDQRSIILPHIFQVS